VVVTLFKADNQTGTGPVNSQLVGGTISNDMLEGPMAGKTLEGDLVKAIQNGETYVNVHTTENPKWRNSWTDNCRWSAIRR
jgi:hypothetical protein